MAKVKFRTVATVALFVAPHRSIEAIEGEVVSCVGDNLQSLRQAGLLDRTKYWEAHNAVFEPYRAFVRPAWLLQMPLRSVGLWLDRLEPMVSAFEANNGSLHKGAPIANMAASLFMGGDYLRAAQYLFQADEENRLSNGAPHGLAVGGGYGRTVLLEPIYDWIRMTFGGDYNAAFGTDLSSTEVDAMLQYVSKRTEDGVVFVWALWRLAAQLEGPDNTGSRLQRVRALADLLIVAESGLRRWQPAGVGGQLHNRAVSMLDVWKAAAKAGFDDVATNRGYGGGAWWEDPAHVNAMLAGEVTGFDRHGAPDARIGASAFVCVKLRNALLHVLDNSLTIYADQAMLLRAVGLCLIFIRSCSLAAPP